MRLLSSFGRIIGLLFFVGLLIAENKQIGWPPGGNFHFKPDVSNLSSWYLLNRDIMWCIKLASSCNAWLLPPNNWQSASTSLANSWKVTKHVKWLLLRRFRTNAYSWTKTIISYLEKWHWNNIVENRMSYGHYPSVYELNYFSFAVDGVFSVLSGIFHMISKHADVKETSKCVFFFSFIIL